MAQSLATQAQLTATLQTGIGLANDNRIETHAQIPKSPRISPSRDHLVSIPPIEQFSFSNFYWSTEYIAHCVFDDHIDIKKWRSNTFDHLALLWLIASLNASICSRLPCLRSSSNCSTFHLLSVEREISVVRFIFERPLSVKWDHSVSRWSIVTPLECRELRSVTLCM